MCIAPIVVDGGMLVSCRNCWQCKLRREDDWVGRNIAESKTALAAHVITLTYGPNWRSWENTWGREDHARARVLTYSDVQKMFKRLRFDGYKFSYFVAGEYGSERRRAHWHVVIYWYSPPPEITEIKKNVDWAYWWEGHVYWDRPSHGAIRYACKYLMKDPADDEMQGMLMMSKKPPIGARYFARKAQLEVDEGVSPQDPFYSFAGITRRTKKGGRAKRIEFCLTGRSLEMYLDEYIDRWIAKHGPRQPWPESELLDERWEARGEKVLEALQMRPRPAPPPKPHVGTDWGSGRPVRRLMGDHPDWMDYRHLFFDEIRNRWYIDPSENTPNFWRGQFVNKRWYYCLNEKGYAEWRDAPNQSATKLSMLTETEYLRLRRPV